MIIKCKLKQSDVSYSEESVYRAEVFRFPKNLRGKLVTGKARLPVGMLLYLLDSFLERSQSKK